MDIEKFKEKINLICDPYFDREFFTNLIYCVDRNKSPREIFEAVMQETSLSPFFDRDLDRAILHLFYSYQASSALKTNYQWLPLAQGIYTLALYRGDGQKLVGNPDWAAYPTQASTPKEFAELIRKDIRGVESERVAWESFLFLLDNRSTRAAAISSVLRQAFADSDSLTFEMLVKAIDMALIAGWKSNGPILQRAFNRFWKSAKAPKAAAHSARLASLGTFNEKQSVSLEWKESWTESLWKALCEESAESGWSFIERMMNQGASFDQISELLTLYRGRAMASMKREHWPRVTSSIIYADALHSSARWVPEEKLRFLAASVLDLFEVLHLTTVELPQQATGNSILDGVSKNISKDRLVLRLDDSIERGLRDQSLELLAVILKDEGLSNSVSDRLLLIASKQDGWTYDMTTIPVTYLISRAFNACARLNVKGAAVSDSLFGLLRYLSDQRESALGVVPRTGTYGEGLPLSQFDVSGGARIVDRFVFNSLRNAQRVKVWPTDN